MKKYLYTLLISLLFVLFMPPVFGQWNDVSYTQPVGLRSGFFYNATVGYAVGDTGTAIKTVNGGTTWSLLPVSDNKNFNDIFFTDLQNGYIAGDSGIVLKTTDGGNTWNIKNSGVAYRLNGLYFFNTDTGFVVGDNGIILKTDNGGDTWTSVPTPTVYILKDVKFYNNTGFAVGNYGTIIKTSDWGNFWIPQVSNTNNTLSGVSLLNESICYIAGDDGTIIKTEDTGNNWLLLQNFTNENINDVYCFANGGCFAAGNNGIIFKSSSDSIWTSQISNTIYNIKSISFLNKDTGFVVGSNGLVLKTLNGGFNYIKEVFEKNIKVSIFPNPFANSTTLQLSKPLQNASLSIYDMLGKEVKSFHNINGTEIKISGAGMKSGIYFFTLVDTKGFIGNGKMILE